MPGFEMRSVAFPEDEGLHSAFTHEWWYFFASLEAPSTGAKLHYTTALMRHDIGWVSYARWWLGGEAPVLWKALHGPPAHSPHGQELVVRPSDGWRVLLGVGHSVHWLGSLGELHFRDDVHGACLHTPLADGGIRRYGGPFEMAWYSWPRLRVRGRLKNQSVELTGHGWMEHQWGNTDFRELTWRYVPVIVPSSDARFIAFRYEHAHYPNAATLEVAELTGGEARPIPGATLAPSGPGGLTTRVSLGSRGALDCVSRPKGQIDLEWPLVPRFYEGPTDVTGMLDQHPVTAMGITEFHPLLSGGGS